jgi:hypothetical protein
VLVLLEQPLRKLPTDGRHPRFGDFPDQLCYVIIADSLKPFQPGRFRMWDKSDKSSPRVMGAQRSRIGGLGIKAGSGLPNEGCDLPVHIACGEPILAFSIGQISSQRRPVVE